MCASGDCSGCSILADLELEMYRVECIVCGAGGEMVRHAEELMHAECVEAFEALTDNAATGGGA